MVLALIFAELLAGGVLITSGITGHTPTEVIKGETKPWISFGKKEKSVVPGINVKEEEGLFSGEGKASLEPLEKGSAPSPTQIKLPKTINYHRLQELTITGGPKGHLTPSEVKQILEGKVSIADAEKALGLTLPSLSKGAPLNGQEFKVG